MRAGALCAAISLAVPCHAIDQPRGDEALASLGQALFASTLLSGDRDTACLSCHHPYFAGGDGRATPIGPGALDPTVVGPWRRPDHALARPQAERRTPSLVGRPPPGVDWLAGHIADARIMRGTQPATNVLLRITERLRAGWHRDGRTSQNWLPLFRRAFAERDAYRAITGAHLLEALRAWLGRWTDADPACFSARACADDWLPGAALDVDGWMLAAFVPPDGWKPRFREVAWEAGIRHLHRPTLITDSRMIAANQAMFAAGGVAAGDFDGDGDGDLFFVVGAEGRPHDTLYRNRGDGTFEDVTLALGIATGGNGSGPTFADLDGDGDLDLLVGGVRQVRRLSMLGTAFVPEQVSPAPFAALENLGGRFRSAEGAFGIAHVGNALGFAAADVDADGRLDLFEARWQATHVSGGSHLWRGLPGGRFRAADIEAGLAGVYSPRDFSFTPNFSDLDFDGDPDLVVAADFLTSRVFENIGAGRFVDRTDPEVITDENGMGAAIGDFDGDGDFDWFVSSVFDAAGGRAPIGSWGKTGNRLYRNDGGLRFTDVTERAGVRRGYWGWAACARDFDNDGDLDIYQVSGYGDPRVEVWSVYAGHYQHTPANYFENRGDGTFIERARELGIADRGTGRGLACFDYDNDGDIDIVAANASGSARLYRNDLVTPRRHDVNWLEVQLRGPGGNTEAVGARIELWAGGRRQVRELRLGSHFASQDPVYAHFGLGAQRRIERLVIIWPDAEHTRSTIGSIPANQRLRLNYPGNGDRGASR